MWTLAVPAVLLAVGGWLSFARRKANSDYIRRLANLGFRMSGRIDARGGEAIVFDDSNRQAAFVKSDVRRILAYCHSLQWGTEHQVNGRSPFPRPYGRQSLSAAYLRNRSWGGPILRSQDDRTPKWADSGLTLIAIRPFHVTTHVYVFQ
jgi:hypothetical protein